MWNVFKKVIKFGPSQDQNIETLLKDFEKVPFVGWFYLITTLNVHFLNYLTLLRVCQQFSLPYILVHQCRIVLLHVMMITSKNMITIKMVQKQNGWKKWLMHLKLTSCLFIKILEDGIVLKKNSKKFTKNYCTFVFYFE